MCTKNITIVPPDGYEVDEAKSTLVSIVLKPIENKPIENKIFFSWDKLAKINGCYTSSCSNVIEVGRDCEASSSNRNIYPTWGYAQASLAQAQLLQLREAVNEGWAANWSDTSQPKYSILINTHGDYQVNRQYSQTLLNFKTKEMAEAVLVNNRDLLNQYKLLAGS
jgi:hypothetical protein